MTTPEAEILDRIIARLDKLLASAAADLEWVEGVPGDLATFEAMDGRRQSASRAFLKSFEQVEDQLSRAFRAIPDLVGEKPSRRFARDFADFMEKIGILDDAAQWERVVRLRDDLVHDYPLDPQIQFNRLISAIGYLPLLVETHRRLVTYARDELRGTAI